MKNAAMYNSIMTVGEGGVEKWQKLLTLFIDGLDYCNHSVQYGESMSKERLSRDHLQRVQLLLDSNLQYLFTQVLRPTSK